MKAAANFRFYQRLIFPEGWRCDYSLSSDLFFLLRSTSQEKYQLQQIWLLMLHFFFFFFFGGSDSQTCDGCRANAAPFTKSGPDKCLALCAVGTRREKHPDSCCHQGVLKEEQEICYAGKCSARSNSIQAHLRVSVAARTGGRSVKLIKTPSKQSRTQRDRQSRGR